jgi:hypothetical protein
MYGVAFANLNDGDFVTAAHVAASGTTVSVLEVYGWVTQLSDPLATWTSTGATESAIYGNVFVGLNASDFVTISHVAASNKTVAALETQGWVTQVSDPPATWTATGVIGSAVYGTVFAGLTAGDLVTAAHVAASGADVANLERYGWVAQIAL